MQHRPRSTKPLQNQTQPHKLAFPFSLVVLVLKIAAIQNILVAVAIAAPAHHVGDAYEGAQPVYEMLPHAALPEMELSDLQDKFHVRQLVQNNLDPQQDNLSHLDVEHQKHGAVDLNNLVP